MSAISSRLLAAVFSRSLRAFAAFVCLILLSFDVTARAAVIRGTVTDPLGRPVAGARVELRSRGDTVQSVETATDGAYRIETEGQGRFELAACGP